MTKEDTAKKERTNKMIIGIVLVIIMALSTLGYAVYSGNQENKKKESYNGIRFIQNENGYWNFEVDGIKFYSQYTPKDTQNFSSSISKTINEYGGRPVYFIGNGQARRELEMNIGLVATKIQDGCLIELNESCKEDSPMKDCSSDNILIIQEDNSTRIIQDKGCIYIYSPYDEQIKAADYLLFKLLGVQ